MTLLRSRGASDEAMPGPPPLSLVFPDLPPRPGLLFSASFTEARREGESGPQRNVHHGL